MASFHRWVDMMMHLYSIWSWVSPFKALAQFLGKNEIVVISRVGIIDGKWEWERGNAKTRRHLGFAIGHVIAQINHAGASRQALGGYRVILSAYLLSKRSHPFVCLYNCELLSGKQHFPTLIIVCENRKSWGKDKQTISWYNFNRGRCLNDPIV